MSTLKQRFWEGCSKIIKNDFPCNSCFECQVKQKQVNEWLQQKQVPNAEKQPLLWLMGYKFVINELLEDLEEKKRQ